MFSRKSKADKEWERLEKQRAEEARKHDELGQKSVLNRNAIVEKNRDKLQPESNDKDIIAFAYSPNEKVVLTVYPDRIRLRSFQKSSLFSTGLRGEKTLYLSKITSVQLKEPGTVTVGYIQFKVGGEGESRSSTMDAVSDENAVTFTGEQLLEFTRIRDIIEKLLQDMNSRLHSGSSTSSVQRSPAEEIKKYHDLLVAGAITDTEFQNAKKRILGK